jgi:hypothetical protein
VHYAALKGDARGPAFINCPGTRANSYGENASERGVGTHSLRAT